MGDKGCDHFPGHSLHHLYVWALSFLPSWFKAHQQLGGGALFFKLKKKYSENTQHELALSTLAPIFHFYFILEN